mgnify:FL=1
MRKAEGIYVLTNGLDETAVHLIGLEVGDEHKGGLVVGLHEVALTEQNYSAVRCGTGCH